MERQFHKTSIFPKSIIRFNRNPSNKVFQGAWKDDSKIYKTENEDKYSQNILDEEQTTFHFRYQDLDNNRN